PRAAAPRSLPDALPIFGAALGWTALARTLFGGDNVLTALLLAGVGAYGASYLVRGLLGGVRWFGGYGICLLADALVRLAVAAPRSEEPRLNSSHVAISY